jgi:hypothetical protein
VDEAQCVIIGHKAENPTMLSPCEWHDVFLDQGVQVRRGERKNGTWHLEVASTGEYTFELRRWPREKDSPITAALPPKRVEDGQFPAGPALPVAKARLKIGALDQTAGVASSDKSVTFRASLASGPVELQTWFYDDGGQALCGAYYVYVTRIRPAAQGGGKAAAAKSLSGNAS